MDKFWTDERVEKLKNFWALGHSAGVIAKQLGDGCTRNMVIGKSNRLKLPAVVPQSLQIQSRLICPPRRKFALRPSL